MSPDALAKWRKFLTAACILLLVLDVLADPIKGQPFAFGAGQAVFFVALLLVIASLHAARYVVTGYALLCILVCTVVILLLVIDRASEFATARIEADMRESWGGMGAEQDQVSMDQDGFDGRLAYRPFVTWRHTPYASTTTNVDSAGLRVTTGSRCAAGTLRVFMFGGSTMWGYQARDSGTIASHLQSSLSRASTRPVCVVNAGEMGWVSSQELIMLTQLLRNGDAPDAIIFYDGINDTYAAIEPESKPGDHVAMRRIQSRMALGAAGMARRIVTESRVVRMMDAWRAREQAGHTPSAAERQQVAQLAGLVVALYAGNVRTIADIAQARGMPALFFWQPTLEAGQKPMSEAEARMCRVRPWASRRVFHDSYRRATQLADTMPAVHDISAMFAADTARIYVDEEHISSQGNRRVADVMMSWIVRDSQWVTRFPGVERFASTFPAYQPPAMAPGARVCEAP